MKNNNNTNMLMMTKNIKKGDKIYPNNEKVPIAIAEDNFNIGEIGIIDKIVMYPVLYNKNVLLTLPGLKKLNNNNAKKKNYIILSKFLSLIRRICTKNPKKKE